MYCQCQGYDPGIMATIRHQLKKTHFTNFPQLLNALCFIDEARSSHKQSITCTIIYLSALFVNIAGL